MIDIDQILDEILDEFESYDGSVESGARIIESNQIRMDILKDIFAKEDMALSTYQSKMEMVLERQGKLIESLESEKAELMRMLEQINRRNKVVTSYLTKNRKSIFVDKDI
ncbi:MAG: hypothetical protein GX053_04120 [Tissierella sp.]|nr:hypothetical protein [Tissierella sp.]